MDFYDRSLASLGPPPLRAIIEVLEALPPPETEAAANTESLSTGWGEGSVC